MQSGQQRSGHFLGDLLRRPGPYRDRWERHVRRRHDPALVSHAAVAEVLARWLWRHGPPEHGDVLARQLRDRVARALTGEVLTEQTLGWFEAAFDLSDADRRQARDLLRGEEPLHVVTGRIPSTGPDRIRRSDYETVAAHHFHRIGPDRRPVTHRLTSTIRAIADRVDTFTFVMDEGACALEVERGGRPVGPLAPIADAAWASDPRQWARYDEVWAADVALSRPLLRGQTTSLAATVRFGEDARPDPTMTRAVPVSMRNCELDLRFSPGVVPRRVFWSEWWEDRNAPSTETEVVLDAEHGVNAFVENLRRCVVGFRWEWD